MSDASDRTIPATPRRREAARQQGMMPLSSLPAWLAAVLTAVALAPAWAAATLPAAAEMLRRSLGAAGQGPITAVDAAALLAAGLFMPSAAVILASGVVGIGVRLLLDGAAWRPARIMPTFQRVDPLAGLSRIFSWSTATAIVANAIALAVLGAAAAWSVAHAISATGGGAIVIDPVRLVAGGQQAILPLAAAAAVVAAVQWALARRRFEARIRMTPQEYQDEMRSMQADPKVRLMREQTRRPAPRAAAADSRSDR